MTRVHMAAGEVPRRSLFEAGHRLNSVFSLMNHATSARGQSTILSFRKKETSYRLAGV